MDVTRIKAEDLVVSNAEAILLYAGFDPAYLRHREGPCPICGGNHRFRWRKVKEDGFCNQCRHLSFFDLLKHHLGTDFQGACDFVRAWAGKSSTNIRPKSRPAPSAANSWGLSAEETEKLRQKYLKLWSGAGPVQGSPAQAYLDHRVQGLDQYPKVLRHHPGLEYWRETEDGKFAKEGVYHGLLAAVQGPDDRVCNIWRTFITPDGQKAPLPDAKKAAGKFLVPGGAVRLFEPQGDELGIAEGIENALKAWTLYGIPTWPCLNANGIAQFVLPPAYAGRIKKLRIFGDNDAPDKFGRRAGNDAAKKLKERAMGMGLRSTIILPRRTDYDLADISKD